MKKVSLVMFCIFGFMLVLASPYTPCAELATAAEKEVKIGAIVALSGPGSEDLSKLARAIEFTAEWINDKGGLKIRGENYRIRIVLEDDKMNPEGAIAAANKLVYDHKVKFIMGPNIPPFKAAVSKITEDNKVVRVDVTGQAGEKYEIGPGVPYTFVNGLEVASQDPGRFLKEYPKVKTVALIWPDDPSLNAVAAVLRSRFESYGVKVVGNEIYPFGASDFYPILTKLFVNKPDALINVAGMPTWIGNVFKQTRELGFKGPMASFAGGADPYVTLKIAGKDYATDIWVHSFPIKDPGMTPMIKEIDRLVKTKLGVDATYDYIMGWEALTLLTQAIERAQSLDPTVVKNTFETMTNIQTPSGIGKMGGLKTFGANHTLVRPVPIARIMDGEVKFVGWFTPDVP
jgi:branched-chain amino acid transport system substrate-binding protein